MLEQDKTTAMWKEPVEVLIPQVDEMAEFKSYTIRIQAKDSQTDETLINDSFKLKCSTTAEISSTVFL